MRDGVAIFKAGYPVVVVVQTSFENAARAQAKIQGVPNLKILVIPHVNVNLPKTEQAVAEAEMDVLLKKIDYALVGIGA